MEANPKQADEGELKSPGTIAVTFDDMARKHFAEVLAMEYASFDYPWCEEEFRRILRKRTCWGMVALHEKRVVGFMIYEFFRKRVHILDCVTHPQFRRQGIGRQMIAKFTDERSGYSRNHLALYVRETNLHAQLFFKAAGLRATECLREYYPDTGEDAFKLVCDVGQPLVTSFGAKAAQPATELLLTGAGYGGRLQFLDSLDQDERKWWKDWEILQGLRN